MTSKQPNASAQRGFEIENDTISWSNYQHTLVGNHIQSILTGRDVYVFTPPPDYPAPSHDLLENIEDVLAKSDEEVSKAKKIGQSIAQEIELIVPDDARSLPSLEPVPA